MKRTSLSLRFLVLLLCLAASGFAQSVTSNISASTEHPDATQIAIPGGAGATVSGAGTAGAGPLIGFQVWQQDRFLLSSFFTFSAPQAISGSQHDFGAFLLNPPGQGTSYSFAGNKVWGCFPIRGCKKDEAPIFVGFGGRAGITNTTWKDGSGDAAQSIAGTVAYVTPTVLITSKTYATNAPSEGNNDSGGQNKASNNSQDDANQYQFGVSVGPSFRFIAGDLAQGTNESLRKELLGTAKKSMTGMEMEFFVRMNSFRPFVRYSRFNLPGSINIPGFSGSQVIFGVDVLSAIFKKTLQ
jgi:hypothetical protein